jgi:hypothetical protein
MMLKMMKTLKALMMKRKYHKKTKKKFHRKKKVIPGQMINKNKKGMMILMNKIVIME